MNIIMKQPTRRSFENNNMPRRGSSSAAPAAVDRNALERLRRLHMKELFSKLAFILPFLVSKSVNELLEQAISHVRQLVQKVEILKEKKKQLTEGHDQTGRSRRDDRFPAGSSSSTVLTVRDVDSLLEVCVKGRSNNAFTLNQVIQVVEEEAAQVVAVSYSYVRGAIFYIIKAQAVSPRIGVEASTVYEKLKELIF